MVGIQNPYTVIMKLLYMYDYWFTFELEIRHQRRGKVDVLVVSNEYVLYDVRVRNQGDFEQLGQHDHTFRWTP